jgi:hypothetical protein
VIPSLRRGGRILAYSGNDRSRFSADSSIEALAPPTDRVTQGVARRRGASRVPQMCPECVRVFNGQTTAKCQFPGILPRALWRTRTADPLLTMEVLYQLS